MASATVGWGGGGACGAAIDAVGGVDVLGGVSSTDTHLPLVVVVVVVLEVVAVVDVDEEEEVEGGLSN